MAQILGVAEADFLEVPAASPRNMVLLEAATSPEEPVANSSTTAPEPYTLNLDGLDPSVYEGGTVTNVRGKELARLDGISFLPLFIEVGGVRELHWHPNANEIVYVNSGEAEIGLAGPGGLRETFTIGPGDLASSLRTGFTTSPTPVPSRWTRLST